MTLLKRALCLSAMMHDGQVDKGGQPYILHPIRLMLKCETEEERVVALLHDVVEDTPMTLTCLRDFEGIPENIIEAIDCLTRRSEETYDEFIERVKTNELATKIKIYDLEDNMDISRLKEFTDKDQKRINRYATAMYKLTDGKRYE
jgi:Guanosine polyphosphate pyrophosphohydrolases/synthetases